MGILGTTIWKLDSKALLNKGGELFDHDDDGPEPELSELIKEFKDMDEEDLKIFNSLQQERPSDAF